MVRPVDPPLVWPGFDWSTWVSLATVSVVPPGEVQNDGAALTALPGSPVWAVKAAVVLDCARQR
jgi:hypothetical protein